jgi:hypothetical protein
MGRHVVELTSKEIIELRDFVAYAVRQRFGTKAARVRMVQLVEHRLLHAVLTETPAPTTPREIQRVLRAGAAAEREFKAPPRQARRQLLIGHAVGREVHRRIKRALAACCCAGLDYHPDKPCPVHPKRRRT